MIKEEMAPAPEKGDEHQNDTTNKNMSMNALIDPAKTIDPGEGKDTVKDVDPEF